MISVFFLFFWLVVAAFFFLLILLFYIWCAPASCRIQFRFPNGLCLHPVCRNQHILYALVIHNIYFFLFLLFGCPSSPSSSIVGIIVQWLLNWNTTSNSSCMQMPVVIWTQQMECITKTNCAHKWTYWVIPRIGNKSISLPWRLINRFYDMKMIKMKVSTFCEIS